MGLYDRLAAEHGLFKQVIDKHKGRNEELAHSSSRDTAKYYSKHQDRWRAFSEDVMKTLVSHLSTEEKSFTPPTDMRGPQGMSEFEQIFAYCAQKRADIAKELNHEPVDNFGTFRGEGFTSYELFYGDPDIKQAWGEMQQDMFRRVISLVSEIPTDSFIEGYGGPESKTFENDNMRVERIEIMPESKDDMLGPDIKFDSGFLYNIYIKPPSSSAAQTKGKNQSYQLSQISLVHNPANSKQNLMNITYTHINKYSRIGDFNIADHHFKHLLAMKTETKADRQLFLEELGRLNHLMAHLLPVKRGNAGICEWITRSVALKKGIELGEFNRDEPLSWDFQALTTPNREDYAKWYASKAFLDMVVKSGPERTSLQPPSSK